MRGTAFSNRFLGKWIVIGVSVLALTACDENGQFAFPSLAASGDASTPTTAGQSVSLVERDVEAPEVFQATEAGLWDGRPSLGGIWVAHPDVKDPERVIIRNTETGTFVIGALFRRERENPGPRLQVSSDAADALGMLAGAPANLSVVALRREEVAETAPAPIADETTADFDAPDVIEATSLDPIANASAAIDAAEATAPAATPTPAATPAPVQSSSLDKPYIQVGIFSVEANANNTANQMRGAGIVPTVIPGSSQGRTFFRVVVGPASSRSERSALLESVKAQGFSDAYFVSN
jgi:cell division septation protein DedD